MVKFNEFNLSVMSQAVIWQFALINAFILPSLVSIGLPQCNASSTTKVTEQNFAN